MSEQVSNEETPRDGADERQRDDKRGAPTNRQSMMRHSRTEPDPRGVGPARPPRSTRSRARLSHKWTLPSTAPGLFIESPHREHDNCRSPDDRELPFQSDEKRLYAFTVGWSDPEGDRQQGADEFGTRTQNISPEL